MFCFVLAWHGYISGVRSKHGGRNTKVEEASSFCCDSVSPMSAKEHNCVWKFANKIERD